MVRSSTPRAGTRSSRRSGRAAPWLFALALGASLGAPRADAMALPAPSHAGKRPPAIDADALRAELASGDPARVTTALEGVKQQGPKAADAAPAIEELLERGTTVALAESAIEALGVLGATSSSAVLRPYIHHRQVELRRAAARALGRTKGPDAVAAFREGLRSNDGQVRGVSAKGLGDLGAEGALPDLFTALDRGVVEAAPAIGQVCGATECERLAAYAGKLALDVMTSGVDPVLFRKKPLPDDVLTRIVGKIADLRTPEAARYLGEVKARWPARGSRKVKEALEKAVSTIAGGGSRP